MGGIYIAIEKEIPGFDPFVNGKAISRASELEIARICTEAGVGSLWGYVSQNADDLADFLEDEGMTPSGHLPEEDWYEPQEGLSFAVTLAAHLEAHPDCIRNAAEILQDLQDYEKVFVVLVQHQVRWHFAVDF